jgi:hypothetical protein
VIYSEKVEKLHQPDHDEGMEVSLEEKVKIIHIKQTEYLK